MNATRKKRLAFVGVIILFAGAATALTLTALQEQTHLFREPAQLQQADTTPEGTFRLGGMVQAGTISRDPDSLAVRFTLTDGKATVPVQFEGILPDLFREEQGAIATGKLDANGVFIAEEVLAKHDEEYVPRELKDTMDRMKAAKEAQQS